MTKLTLPAPREPAVDLRTGTFTRNWILYLQQSFDRLGGSDAESITAITALVSQLIQDTADNEVERAFSSQPGEKAEDVIEFAPPPAAQVEQQDQSDYAAQVAELRKKVSELEMGLAFNSDPSALIAETRKTTVSGTYTPTLTNVANLDASTAYKCQYMRIGNIVTVSGRADIDPTAVALTQLGISLPIPSNFGAADDCAGNASASAATRGGGIYADVANDRALLEVTTSLTTNYAMYFVFQYQII